AFVGAFVLDRKFGLDRGFEVYDDEFSGDAGATDLLDMQRPGAAVVGAALKWKRDKRPPPFFCWGHFYEPHAPYSLHEEQFGDQFKERAYDAEIAYVDRQVGRLLEFLRTEGLDSRTLVVVVGDHGEGLGDHVERTHGATLYNEALRVPLVFR